MLCFIIVWLFCVMLYVEGSLLPLGEVLNHIRAVLDNRKMKEWAAMDYTHILMVHILSVPHYILNISATQWEGELDAVSWVGV